MGKLTLHTGSRGSYYYFKEKVLNHLSGTDPESFLYLLPVNRSVRYFKKKLVAETGQKSLIDPNIYSFRSFIHSLYNQFPEKKKILSPSIRLLLVQHILNNKEQDLNYFQSSGNFSNGLILKTNQMVEEFFQFGYRPNDLSAAPSSAVNKYSDFGYIIDALFEIYQNKLTDESCLLGETITVLDTNILKRYYPLLKKVYISGFGIYSPPMFQFINLLKDIYDVEIKLEYNSENKELFKHTSDAHERLSKMSDRIVNLPDDHDPFYKRLFQSSDITTHLTEFPVKLKIQKLQSRVEEINYTATKIKQLHHASNIPLNEIGITFPDVEKYVPLIKKIFKDYAIPFNLSTGFSLAESSLIQAFMQVLRIVISRFSTDEVFKLAISPFLRKKLTTEANLIRQSAKKIRLNYLHGNWEQRIRQVFNPVEDDDSLINISGKISEDQLNEMLLNISNLLNTIKPLTTKLSAEEFQLVYTDVLKRLGLLDWYQHDRAELGTTDNEKEYRAFNRFIKLMDQVIWMLKYIHGKNPIDSQDFFRYLTIVFENATYNLREWSDFGVQIMPRLEILSLDMQTLFLGGLVEGDFPRHFSRDIFFSDEERAEIGLNASEDLLSQDRFLFFQLITCGAKTVHLTYPLFESETSLLPSTFLTSLKEIFPGIDVQENVTNKKFISPSSVPEHLSESLKSGLEIADKDLYSFWINHESSQKVKYWHNGIRSLYSRRSYRERTQFEGNLTDSGAVRRSLEESHLKRPFSITALESYAFCPMQYFLQRIVKLEPEEDTEATITPLERGNLIHKVLYKFYHQLTDAERKKPWEFDIQLIKIASDIFHTLPYRDILWEIEKEKYFGSQTGQGLWEKFLLTEKEYLQQTGFIPSYFESDFGYLKKSGNKKSYTAPLVIKHQEKEIKIYGKIDRIDVGEKGRFIVIDYKSGQGAMKIKAANIVDGLSLQLPVYIAAAKQLLQNRSYYSVPAAGMYYQVQDADNCQTKFVLTNRESGRDLPGINVSDKEKRKDDNLENELTFSEIIDNTLNHISIYIEKMGGGNFQHTASPKDPKCASYCSFKRICRKDTGKLLSLQE
jgi:ATP-dependent helicase/DNAse subunit B